MAKWQIQVILFLTIGVLAFLYGKSGNTTIPEYEERITVLETEKKGYKRKAEEKEDHLKDMRKEMKRIKKQYDKIKYRTNFIDAMGDMYPVP